MDGGGPRPGARLLLWDGTCFEGGGCFSDNMSGREKKCQERWDGAWGGGGQLLKGGGLR